MEYKNELVNHRHDCDCKNGCDKNCEVYAEVSVPVELMPEARVGDIDVTCCGDPTVETECGGAAYKIVITQQLLVKIPISFTVKSCR